MTMSPQEISYRLEIEQLLIRYCHAIDQRDWDAYRAVYTPDAIIDDVGAGLWYDDQLVRTPDGWKIQARRNRLLPRHAARLPLRRIISSTDGVANAVAFDEADGRSPASDPFVRATGVARICLDGRSCRWWNARGGSPRSARRV
jgi:SnoaL-like domain